METLQKDEKPTEQINMQNADEESDEPYEFLNTMS